jgi:hypothetical protein
MRTHKLLKIILHSIGLTLFIARVPIKGDIFCVYIRAGTLKCFSLF